MSASSAVLRHPFRVGVRRGVVPWAGLAVFAALAVPLGVKAGFWQGSWGLAQQ
jgi:hypothetical protein